MSKIKVGINGFGRIGRILFRAGFDKLDIVGINDTSGAKTAAHLLKYDSSHGIYDKSVESTENSITVDGKVIPVSGSRNPEDIPWKEWGADIVLECTGAFKHQKDLARHMTNSDVKKVLVSAPAPGADLTIVYGINHKDYDPSKHQIISNASCTTNCLAPLAKVINEDFGIESGMMTTVHSYTNDQRILDSGHSDLRRARAAAVSMIPTTTGAAIAVTKVLPELEGKIDGTSVRVPTPNVSLVDFVVQTKKKVSVESVNESLTTASNSYLKGILATEEAPLVSCDYMSNPYSSIVDKPCTMVTGDNMVKVLSWYDNEAGFSHRMIDMALFMAEKGL
ncbi:MAG: type I glyceraldehyde-3-phosphate dehydrogenase [Bdellovibrionales bacterium]